MYIDIHKDKHEGKIRNSTLDEKHANKPLPTNYQNNDSKMSINHTAMKNQIKTNIQKNRQDSQNINNNDIKLEKHEFEPATIFTQKSEIEKSNYKNLYTLINQDPKNKQSLNQNLNFHKSKFEMSSDPIFDSQSELMAVENEKILNPPPISFLETNEIVSFDKNLFNSLISKSNFNLETQRRGRRRSRFPDPQWDCAEAQIAKLVRYLCEEEMSASYQKYCKPIFEQINTMIESFLYHDNNLEVCQNIHMCPVTVDI
jgi:hypothetical protein